MKCVSLQKKVKHNKENLEGMSQTKMEGGTERHLPKTDDWRRWVHR